MAGLARLFSTVTCAWADGPELGAGYWYDNVRQTVRFEPSVRALAADGYRLFVEVSPHAVLTAAITETAQDADAADGLVVTGTLDREDAGAGRLLAALARVHVHGPRVDWAAVLGGGRRVDLPTYAFQHQLFWPEPPAAAGDGVRDGRGRRRDGSRGPVLGRGRGRGPANPGRHARGRRQRAAGRGAARTGVLAAPGTGPVGHRELALPDLLGAGGRAARGRAAGHVAAGGPGRP